MRLRFQFSSSLHHLAFILSLLVSIGKGFNEIRRNLISQLPALALAPLSLPKTGQNSLSDIKAELEKSQLYWTDNEDDKLVDWNRLRYGTSTLIEKSSNILPESAAFPSTYPKWLEGCWRTKYEYLKASFPQGRNVISVRVPGAGLATCLALPNVGYNPYPFVQKFLSNGAAVYEDVAYNIPRKMEAFWSDCKVIAVQTETKKSGMSPKCCVSGVGCTKAENPSLHLPSTRFVVDFEGPTRSAGRKLQSIDLTLMNASSSRSVKGSFKLSKQYAQFNVQQDFQTFYKETIILKSTEVSDTPSRIEGLVKVSAFLPRSKTSGGGQSAITYDDSRAVALYDYSIELTRELKSCDG